MHLVEMVHAGVSAASARMGLTTTTTRISRRSVTAKQTTQCRVGAARRAKGVALRTGAGANAAIVMRTLPRTALHNVRAAGGVRADGAGARRRELTWVGSTALGGVKGALSLRQPRRHAWPRAPYCVASADKPVRAPSSTGGTRGLPLRVACPLRETATPLC